MLRNATFSSQNHPPAVDAGRRRENDAACHYAPTSKPSTTSPYILGRNKLTYYPRLAAGQPHRLAELKINISNPLTIGHQQRAAAASRRPLRAHFSNACKEKNSSPLT